MATNAFIISDGNVEIDGQCNVRHFFPIQQRIDALLKNGEDLNNEELAELLARFQKVTNFGPQNDEYVETVVLHVYGGNRLVFVDQEVTNNEVDAPAKKSGVWETRNFLVKTGDKGKAEQILSQKKILDNRTIWNGCVRSPTKFRVQHFRGRKWIFVQCTNYVSCKMNCL